MQYKIECLMAYKTDTIYTIRLFKIAYFRTNFNFLHITLHNKNYTHKEII
jgi:DNA-binding LytR/AlgR family response regulator